MSIFNGGRFPCFSAAPNNAAGTTAPAVTGGSSSGQLLLGRLLRRFRTLPRVANERDFFYDNAYERQGIVHGDYPRYVALNPFLPVRTPAGGSSQQSLSSRLEGIIVNERDPRTRAIFRIYHDTVAKKISAQDPFAYRQIFNLLLQDSDHLFSNVEKLYQVNQEVSLKDFMKLIAFIRAREPQNISLALDIGRSIMLKNTGGTAMVNKALQGPELSLAFKYLEQLAQQSSWIEGKEIVADLHVLEVLYANNLNLGIYRKAHLLFLLMGMSSLQRQELRQLPIELGAPLLNKLLEIFYAYPGPWELHELQTFLQDELRPLQGRALEDYETILADRRSRHFNLLLRDDRVSQIYNSLPVEPSLRGVVNGLNYVSFLSGDLYHMVINPVWVHVGRDAWVMCDLLELLNKLSADGEVVLNGIGDRPMCRPVALQDLVRAQ